MNGGRHLLWPLKPDVAAPEERRLMKIERAWKAILAWLASKGADVH